MKVIMRVNKRPLQSVRGMDKLCIPSTGLWEAMLPSLSVCAMRHAVPFRFLIALHNRKLVVDGEVATLQNLPQCINTHFDKERNHTTTPLSRRGRKYPLGMATVRARPKEKRVKAAVALSGRRIRKTAVMNVRH